MTNQEILEQFDKEFPNSRNIFQDDDPYDLRRLAIKNYLLKLLASKDQEKYQYAADVYSWSVILFDHKESDFFKRFPELSPYLKATQDKPQE